MSVVEMDFANGSGGGSSAPAAYYLGALSNGGTMNIASKYDDYANLTSANFLAVPYAGGGITWNYSDSFAFPAGYESPFAVTHLDNTSTTFSPPSISYNPVNGNLTYSCYNRTDDTSNVTILGATILPKTGNKTQGISAKIYLVPNIENL